MWIHEILRGVGYILNHSAAFSVTVLTIIHRGCYWFCNFLYNFLCSTRFPFCRIWSKLKFGEYNEAKSGQDSRSPGAPQDTPRLAEDSNQCEDCEDPGAQEADQPGLRGGERPGGGVLQAEAGGRGQQLRQDRVWLHSPARPALLQQVVRVWEGTAVLIQM